MPSTYAQLKASYKYRILHRDELKEKQKMKDYYEENRNKILEKKKNYYLSKSFDRQCVIFRNILL
jgi:hypothetical protein